MKNAFTIFFFLMVCSIYSCVEHQVTLEAAAQLNDKNDFDGARKILDQLIQENPAYDSAYLERGYTNSMLGESHAAVHDYNKAMRNPKLKIPAMEGLVAVFYNEGEYQKAIENCTKIIRIDKNNARAYCNRGIVKSQMKIDGYNPDTLSSTWHYENGVLFTMI